MNENRVPTCGSVISSMDYDIKLKRHCWFRKNKTKLALGGLVILAGILTIAVIAWI